MQSVIVAMLPALAVTVSVLVELYAGECQTQTRQPAGVRASSKKQKKKKKSKYVCNKHLRSAANFVSTNDSWAPKKGKGKNKKVPVRLPENETLHSCSRKHQNSLK